MKIAIVQWADAQSPSVGWLPKEEFKAWCDEDIVICHSVGWLMFENDEFIIISQIELDGDVAESTKIPRSAIRKMDTIDPYDKSAAFARATGVPIPPKANVTGP